MPERGWTIHLADGSRILLELHTKRSRTEAFAVVLVSEIDGAEVCVTRYDTAHDQPDRESALLGAKDKEYRKNSKMFLTLRRLVLTFAGGMKPQSSLKILVVLIAASLMLGAVEPLIAQVIIQDDFSAHGDDGLLAGTTPSNVSPPGATWSAGNDTGSLFLSASFGDPLPSAWGIHQSSGSVSLGDLSSLPTNLLRISASIGLKQLGSGPEGSAQDGRGLGLGFFRNSSGGQFSQAFFTGLVLDTAGRLNFAHDPNASGFFNGSGAVLGTAVAYGGTFNSSSWYDLSYTIDTITGALSEIVLEGSSADYSSLAADVNQFTAASLNIQNAGVYTSSDDIMSGYAGFDNFTVTAVPEPSSLALVALAGLALGGCALHRHRR